MHSSILKRAFRYFLVSMCVIILVFAFFFFTFMKEEYQEQFEAAQFYVTEKTAETVTNLQMDIKQSAYSLCCNETLAEVLINAGGYDLLTQRQLLNRVIVMNTATPTATRLHSTQQVLLVDEQFSFAYAASNAFSLESFPTVHAYSSLTVRNEDWYQKARQYNAQIYAFCHPQAEGKVLFAHLLRNTHITDPRYSDEAGVMLYAMPRNVLAGLLQDDQMSEGSVSLLLFNDLLLGSTNEDLFPSGSVMTDDVLPLSQLPEGSRIAHMRLGGVQYSVTSRTAGSEWRVVLLTPSANARQSLIAMLPLIGLFMLILAAVALVISYMFSRRLSAPILSLSNSMVRASDAQTLPQTIPVPRSDAEIEHLYRSYNDIVENIHHISALERERNAQLQKTELKALQSQINPHFIYNTLDSIGCIALMNGVEDIATMVASLINILKYSIRFSRMRVTLREEIDYLRQYIQIQKLRYSDRFRFECDVPEEYSEVGVPKLMIQPLVENALFYAENAQDQLLIRVWCEAGDGRFRLHVTDNGSGADAERLNERLKADSEGEKYGIGIRNVNKRIQLLAGTEYGILYRLTEEGGLDAVIILPAGGIRFS